jgi:hypothetical protein
LCTRRIGGPDRVAFPITHTKNTGCWPIFTRISHMAVQFPPRGTSRPGGRKKAGVSTPRREYTKRRGRPKIDLLKPGCTAEVALVRMRDAGSLDARASPSFGNGGLRVGFPWFACGGHHETLYCWTNMLRSVDEVIDFEGSRRQQSHKPSRSCVQQGARSQLARSPISIVPYGRQQIRQ